MVGCSIPSSPAFAKFSHLFSRNELWEPLKSGGQDLKVKGPERPVLPLYLQRATVLTFKLLGGFNGPFLTPPSSDTFLTSLFSLYAP